MAKLSAMKIYLDTSNVEEIRKAQLALKEVGSKLGGITTNPTTASQYAAETGREPKDIFLEIATVVDGKISVETIGTDDYNPRNIAVDQLVEEAHEIASWHKRFVVKIPCTPEGLRATRALHGKVPINMTLAFSVDDALCTAIAGANYCSPFVGRLDERIPGEGTRIAQGICHLYREKNFATEVLFASSRNPEHVYQAYQMGAHICTMPYKVFVKLDPRRAAEMQSNPLHYTPKEPTDITEMDLIMPRKEEGLQRFLDDASKVSYSIGKGVTKKV